MRFGTLVSIVGLLGWCALAIRWMGARLVVVIPAVTILLAAVIFLVMDSAGVFDEKPAAVVMIGAHGQYRILVDHSPLDSEPTLAEAEAVLRFFGQTSYRMRTADGEKIVRL